MNLLDNLPITHLKLNVALREHQLDCELDERDIRLRLLAIETELERQSRRISALASRNRYPNNR